MFTSRAHPPHLSGNHASLLSAPGCPYPPLVGQWRPRGHPHAHPHAHVSCPCPSSRVGLPAALRMVRGLSLPAQPALPAHRCLYGRRAGTEPSPTADHSTGCPGSLPRTKEDQGLLKEGAREGAVPARLAAASTGTSGVQAAFCLCCWPQAGQSMKL